MSARTRSIARGAGFGRRRGSARGGGAGTARARMRRRRRGGATARRRSAGATATTGARDRLAASSAAGSGRRLALARATHGSGDVGLARAQAVEHERDAVEVGVERLEAAPASRAPRSSPSDQPRLHQVRELAQAHRAGHARAALERVQRAPQLLRERVVAAARGAMRAAASPACGKSSAASSRKIDSTCVVDVVADAGERIVLDRRQRSSRSASTRRSACGRRDGAIAAADGRGSIGAATGRRRGVGDVGVRAIVLVVARPARRRRVSASRASPVDRLVTQLLELGVRSPAASTSIGVRRPRAALHAARRASASAAIARASTGCAAAGHRRAALLERDQRQLERLRRAPRSAESRRCGGCRTACGSRGPSRSTARAAGRTAAATARARAWRDAGRPRRRGCATAPATA